MPVTALCAVGGRLWIGTQGRGVAEYARQSGTLRWHGIQNGLPDDWVTCLLWSGDTIYAGTFVGGLARLEGSGWTSALGGENVTWLEGDGASGLTIATRTGLWHQPGSGPPEKLNPHMNWLDTETQCLQRVPGGLWVGTRTGLYFMTDRPLRTSEKMRGD